MYRDYYRATKSMRVVKRIVVESWSLCRDLSQKKKTIVVTNRLIIRKAIGDYITWQIAKST